MTRVRVILSAVGDEGDARRLAELWVTTGRAACVTMLPGAESCYRWKGKLCREREVVLLIKTAYGTAEDGERLLASLAADHPYDEPEFLVLDPAAGAPGYLSWVLANAGR